MQILDRQTVLRALTAIVLPGTWTEIRVFDAMDRPGGWAALRYGYFDNAEAAADAIGRLAGWHGVYFIPNPVDPVLAARAANVLVKAKKGEATSDTNILARRWLLADFDPVVRGTTGARVTGICATEAEKAHAMAVQARVVADLAAAGWPMPVQGDSGNGAHLLWRVDLPADSHLPKLWVDALARAYTTDHVDVDVKVANAARIWKLYGTANCKGTSTPDRPWRMATLLDVPDAPGVVTDAMLQAFIDAHPAAAPAPPPPRAAAPAAGADFDPIAMLRAAGHGLDDGAPLPGGGTIHTFDVCPCDRQLDDRAAFVTVAASGAVGVGCHHANCRRPGAAGTPGESWKAIRTGIDPAYDPDGQQAATTKLERRAAVHEGVARLADATRHVHTAPGGALDVSGMMAGVAPKADGPAPVAAAQVRNSAVVGQCEDGRVMVNAAADLLGVTRATAAALWRDPELFTTGGAIVRPGDAGMVTVAAGAIDYACAKAVQFVNLKRDPDTGAWVPNPAAMPTPIKNMLQPAAIAATPDLLGGFKRVDQVTRAPVAMPDGRVVTVNGYVPEIRTLVVGVPDVIRTPEPSARHAAAWLLDLVGDFCFEGGINGAEAHNYVGALLTPLIRHMINGPVPLILIEANKQGTGKSLLGQLIQVIYGLPAETGNMQKDQELFAKQLLSILVEANPVHLFDNVTHAVVSRAFDMVLTTKDSYSDRILGETRTIHCKVRQMFVMTSNNAQLSADLSRRFVRVRLRTDLEDPAQRTDIRMAGTLLDYAADHRGDILARLVQLVDEWVAAGKPYPDGLPVMGSFESFARTVGAILHFAGLDQWLANAAQARAAVTLDNDWQPFLVRWYATGQRRTPAQLVRIAEEVGALAGLLDGSESQKISRMGSALRSRRDQILYGFRILTFLDESTGQHVFSLEPQPGNTAAPPRVAPGNNWFH